MNLCSDELATTEADPFRWYAAYTKHQHEKMASEILSRQGFEVFLPLYAAAHRWKDRTKTVVSPLFRCYVFLRANLERKLDILKTPGVFCLVESGGRACEIPESEIDGIRKIVRSSSGIEPHPMLRSGERVRVLRGPLAGLSGILTRVKGNCRLVLSVELLQKAVAVEVDVSMVEPIYPVAKGVVVAAARHRSSTGGAAFA